MQHPNHTTRKPAEPNRFDNIDYLRILHNVLRFWWVIVLCLGIALGVAWYQNKTSVAIYKAGTIVLLKESDHGRMTELTEGFGLSSEQSNIENQKYIYSSPKMVGRAVLGKGFEVGYWNIGRLNVGELYGVELPFRVVYDTLHAQPIGATFEVVMRKDGKLQMKIEGDGVSGYSYANNDYTNAYVGHIDTTMIVEPGEEIISPVYSFKLDSRGWNDDRERTIRFRFFTMQEVVSQWCNSVNIDINQKGGTVAFITATGTNWRKIMAFLNGLNEASVDYNLDKKNETATRTLSFIKRQLDQTADSLNSAAQRLRKFKIEHNFIGRKEYASNLDKRYYAYEDKLQELTLTEQRLRIANEQLKDGSPIEDYFQIAQLGTENSVIQAQLTEIIALQQELNEDRNQNENNPHKKQLRERESLIRSNVRTLISQSIDVCQQQQNELKSQMNKMSRDADLLPAMEAEYTNLERDYNIQDAVYTFLLQKESETLIAKASNTADNEVLQDPVFYGQISPDTRRNNTMAVAIGLLLPLLVFFFIEFFNNKVRSLKELKRTLPKIPVIAIIPQDKECDDLPTVNQPQSPISENFRALRAKLKFTAADRTCKMIALSSCNAGEGKTFCAVNTSVNFALSGKRCLLMNYDLRRPRAEKVFGIENHVGITDYLIGSATLDEIIIKTDIEGLSIAPAGTIPPNPSELISSDANLKLIEELRNNYDIIIVDTAPIGCVADGRPFETEADILLLVVKSGKTDFGHLTEIAESISPGPKTSLFSLFNGAQHNRRGYARYGYGNYGYTSQRKK